MKFDDLSLSDFKLLIEVSEAESIRKVAMRRNIAQPALSRKIQILESGFGGRLFDRTRSGVKTTAFGKICLAHLAELNFFGKSIERKIADSSGGKSIIRIGTYDSVAVYFFPKLFRSAKANRLNCEIELSLNRSHEIIRRVSEGSLDFGVVISHEKKHSNLLIKTLAEDEFGFYESASRRISSDFYSLGAATDQTGKSILEYSRNFEVIQSRFHDTPSFEVAAALTIAGLGIGILPTRVASRFLKQGQIRQISMNKVRTFGRHSLCIVRNSKNTDRMVEQLVQIVEASLR